MSFATLEPLASPSDPRRNRHRLLAVFALILMGATLCSCGKPASSPEAKDTGGASVPFHFSKRLDEAKLSLDSPAKATTATPSAAKPESTTQPQAVARIEAAAHDGADRRARSIRRSP